MTDESSLGGYHQAISSAHPGAVVLLVDQSGAMGEPFPASSSSKARVVADALNRLLMNVVIAGLRDSGIRNYLNVGVIGYGETVRSVFQGALEQAGGAELVSITQLAEHPVRIEERDRPDGAGGVVKIKMPIWIAPAAGGSSPMAEAFKRAFVVLEPWTRENQTSFPPVVINIAEGEPDDMDAARYQASRLLSLSTNDGHLLLFNFYVSSGWGEPISFPSAPDALPNGLAHFLFDISSVLPPLKVARFAAHGIALGEGARGFVYGGEGDLPEFLFSSAPGSIL